MSEPAPAPATPETPADHGRKQAAQTVVRVTPAWWVPLHAFAVLFARLAYPLALLGVAGWLISVIIKTNASGWFTLAVLVIVAIGLAAAPKDPEA